MSDQQTREVPVEKLFEQLVNRNSLENASNTPDWILGQFLAGCLSCFNTAVQQRETWYGRDARPCATTSPAAANESAEREDVACVCKGNWRAIVKEYSPLLGKQFKAHDGRVFTFFGLVHSDDDYYYGLWSKENGLILSSCVGALESNYEQLDAAIDARRK